MIGDNIASISQFLSRLLEPTTEMSSERKLFFLSDKAL